MTKNKYEISSGIMKALLMGEKVINIQGVMNHSGLTRKEVVDYLAEVRKELGVAYYCYFKALKELR